MSDPHQSFDGTGGESLSESGPQEEHARRIQSDGDGRSPFWTIGTCCGCVIVAIVAVLITFTVIGWKTFTHFIPAEPIVEPSPWTQSDVDALAEKKQAFESGELVTLTPEELTTLVQWQLDDSELEGCGFHVEPAADGQMRMRAAIKFPETAGWPLAGRYVNLELVAKGRIVDHEMDEFIVSRVQFGNSVLADQTSEDVAAALRDQPNSAELRETLDRIKYLEITGDHLKISIVPDKNGDGPDAETPDAESPDADGDE